MVVPGTIEVVDPAIPRRVAKGGLVLEVLGRAPVRAQSGLFKASQGRRGVLLVPKSGMISRKYAEPILVILAPGNMTGAQQAT